MPTLRFRREVSGVLTYIRTNKTNRHWWQPRHRGVIQFHGYEVHGPWKWTVTSAEDWLDYYAITEEYNPDEDFDYGAD